MLALQQAGYADISYFAVPGGYAVVSRVEHIDAEGKPMAAAQRWVADGVEPVGFSLAGYVRRLFTAPPGYYRVLVFVVSTQAFAQSRSQVSKVEAEEWLRAGNNALPAGMLRRPFTEDYICTALVYEFEKNDVQTKVTVRQPGRLSAMTHLANAGVLELMR